MPTQPLKDRIRGLLREGDLEGVADLAGVRRRTLGSFIALTFDDELLVVWRAIEAMGMAAERLAKTNKTYVKEHMRRLYWLITEESGGVFWRAPECMAECAFRLPSLLHSHVRIAFHLLETLEEEDLEHFRPGAIWAIARLKDLAGDDLPAVLPLLVDALERPDPQARGMAVWCLGEVEKASLLEDRPDLLDDDGAVHLYRNREILQTTVGNLTEEVLETAGLAGS